MATLPHAPSGRRARLSPTWQIAIFLLGVASRAVPLALVRPFFEDGYITLRVVRNVVEGLGPVYNAGVRVQAFSSPLWMGALASIASMAGMEGARLAAGVLGVLLGAAVPVFAMATLTRLSVPRDWTLLVAGTLALYPPLALHSICGLETPLLLFLMALATFLAVSRRWVSVGVTLGAVVLTRIDGVLFVCLVFTALALHARAALKIALPSCLVAAGPWLVYSHLYFGSTIPQTAIAKADFYRADALFSIERTYLVLGPVFRVSQGAVTRSIVAITLIVMLGIAATRLVTVRWLCVFLGSYLAAFLLSGTAVMFPWYYAPAHLAVIPAGILCCAWAASGFGVPGASRLTFLLVSVSLGGALVHVWTRDWRQSRIEQSYEDTVRRPLGEWLRARGGAGDVVLLEPAGYIGYYSRLTVLDTVGLTGPDAILARRRYPPDEWLFRLIETRRPRFLVLRDAELQALLKEQAVAGEPSFSRTGWLEARYVPTSRFEGTGGPALNVLERVR